MYYCSLIFIAICSRIVATDDLSLICTTETMSSFRALLDTREPTVNRKFPEGFKFGVATAAFQIEGAWNVADKSPSIWDTYCHQSPNPVVDNTNGDVTCNSYYEYHKDIENIKYLGVDFYRFSISWPRLLPNGFSNKISEDGLRYYNNIIDELIKNGIEPVVTIFHWDLPQNLQDLGGWANPLIANWFEDYARVVYTEFGDRVKTWITINEPKQIALFGYGTGRFAPGLTYSGIADYLAAKNLIVAHARAWRLYDSEFRNSQKGVCGISIATDFRCGASEDPDDIEIGLDAMEFEVGLYTHPIFSKKGGFPERVVKKVAKKSAEQGYPTSRLPEFTSEEIELVKGSSDFYGFNHYSTRFYSPKNGPKRFAVPSYDDDLGDIGSYLEGKCNFEKGASPHVTIIPEGIRAALNWIKDSYDNPPVMITENGFGTLGDKDELRISYYRRYMNSVLNAIEIDQCNVVCYTAWSLMDNFEWRSGLSIKFGLFEVDFNDEGRPRRPRNSAKWYRHIVVNKELDVHYDPK